MSLVENSSSTSRLDNGLTEALNLLISQDLAILGSPIVGCRVSYFGIDVLQGPKQLIPYPDLCYKGVMNEVRFTAF